MTWYTVHTNINGLLCRFNELKQFPKNQNGCEMMAENIEKIEIDKLGKLTSFSLRCGA